MGRISFCVPRTMIVTVAVALLCIADWVMLMKGFISVAMTMTVRMMTMTVLMEKKQPKNVGSQTNAAHDQDQLRVRDCLWCNEALDSFKKDGKTESDQEDAIDQSA